MIAAAWFLFGVVVGIAFLAICIAWDRQPKPAPRRESLSERHDRLDVEARVAGYGATVVPKPRPPLPALSSCVWASGVLCPMHLVDHSRPWTQEGTS